MTVRRFSASTSVRSASIFRTLVANSNVLATRHEASLLVRVPSATLLSRRADEAVFGPDELTQSEIDAFWILNGKSPWLGRPTTR